MFIGFALGGASNSTKCYPMVTVLFNNGAKTFKQDPKDSYGLCDYDYLVNYLEAWVLKRNENLDMFYNHKVKTFARKLANSNHMIQDYS